MHPGAACPHLGQDRLNRVERPGIELAGLDEFCRTMAAGHRAPNAMRRSPNQRSADFHGGQPGAC